MIKYGIISTEELKLFICVSQIIWFLIFSFEIMYSTQTKAHKS